MNNLEAFKKAHVEALTDDFYNAIIDVETYGAVLNMLQEGEAKPNDFELRRAEYYHKIRARNERKSYSFLRKIKQVFAL